MRRKKTTTNLLRHLNEFCKFQFCNSIFIFNDENIEILNAITDLNIKLCDCIETQSAFVCSLAWVAQHDNPLTAKQ